MNVGTYLLVQFADEETHGVVIWMGGFGFLGQSKKRLKGAQHNHLAGHRLT